MDRSPGQRYRFEQYFSFLQKNGVSSELANIISAEDDKVLYASGKYHKKAVIGLGAIIKRYNQLKTIDEFDLVVIYREAILTGSIFFEKKLAKKGIPILFDFDDAIWVKDVSQGNKSLSFLKNANKIKEILPFCNHVTAGNAYLKNFASQYFILIKEKT